MRDVNRLGEPGEKNPNEAMNEGDGSTKGVAPGTGDAGEGMPADGGVDPGGVDAGGSAGDTSGTGR